LFFFFGLLAGEEVIRGFPKYKQPEGWDFGLLPGELAGTSAGIGRCSLHPVGVGIGFSTWRWG